MKPDYDNAMKLDARWWSSNSEIKGTADHLIRNMPDIMPPRFNLNHLKNHLKLILTNLHVAHEISPKTYVSLSLSNNNYAPASYNSKIFLKYKYVKFIVDYLVENQYIELVKGINYDHIKRVSRIRANKKLLRLFHKYKSVEGKTFRINIPIYLRDTNKKELEVNRNFPAVKSKIQNINLINKTISNHIILPIFWFDEHAVDFYKRLPRFQNYTQYYRVFNNNSFESGGRFYGHWSQMMKSDDRQFIKIDGRPTVELDYSCLHFFMLYCLEGIEPPDDDLYRLPDIDPIFRPLIKKAVNIALNALNEPATNKAIFTAY